MIILGSISIDEIKDENDKIYLVIKDFNYSDESKICCYKISHSSCEDLDDLLEKRPETMWIILKDINNFLFMKKNVDLWIVLFNWSEKNKEKIVDIENVFKPLFSKINSPNDKFFQNILKKDNVKKSFLKYIKNNKVNINWSIKKYKYIKDKNGLVDLDMLADNLEDQIKYNNEKKVIPRIYNFIKYIVENYKKDFDYIEEKKSIVSLMINHKNGNYNQFKEKIDYMILKSKVENRPVTRKKIL